MTQFQHPRHAWQGHPNALAISIEDLDKLIADDPETWHHFDQKHVVISCLDQRYSLDWIFGDWIDFEKHNSGLYRREQFPRFFDCFQRLIDNGKKLYFVMPQPYPGSWSMMREPLLSYIEFPEFYGIYHDIFRACYGPAPESGLDFHKHFVFLNKRNRLGRQKLFYRIVDRGLLDRGFVSFLGHGQKSSFDQQQWDQHRDYLLRHDLTLDRQALEYANTLVPYMPDPRMTITDQLCVTGGWLPDLSLYRDAFFDVVFETHESHSGATVFTEKIFRSVYLGRPFLACGGQNFLTEFRKLGFRTFEPWFSESYDLESHDQRRVHVIGNVIEHICSWDLDRCRRTKQEMMPVLLHNQQRLQQLSHDLTARLAEIDRFLTKKFDGSDR